MQSEIFKLLSLTGGGIRGVYTAEVINRLEKHFSKPITQSCDCIAGTSIGGIIALALATGKTGEQLVEVFKLNAEIIFAKKPWYHSWYYSSKYDNAGLRNVINSLLGDYSEATLQELKQYSGLDLLIPTVEMDTGKTILLSSSDEQTKQWKLLDVALATSAAPTFFPAHVRDKTRYIDGGVSCNMPDIFAAQKYCQMRGIEISSLNILSIGTGFVSEKDCPATEIDSNAGAVKWAVNLEYFINVQTPIVVEQSRYFFPKNRYARFDSQLNSEIKLDNTSDFAFNSLIALAHKATEKEEIQKNNAAFVFWSEANN